MSNIYKTPLLKSIKADEKLGAEGKLIGLEDLVPSLAKKIENAVDLDSLDFAKDKGLDGIEGIFDYLNSNRNKIINHGAFMSEEEWVDDPTIYYYRRMLSWWEIKISQEFRGKDVSSFSSYISKYGSTGFQSYYTNRESTIHFLRILDLVPPAEQGSAIVGRMPIPDEILTLCKNRPYSLNVTHTNIGAIESYTNTCRSVLYDSDGYPIRLLPISGVTGTYSCLATINCSQQPVFIDAILTVYE